MKRLILLLTAGHAALSPLLAGPGHDHGPTMHSAGPSGPVTLDESQRRNLGLEVQEADVREMAPSVEVNATLVVPPEKLGQVSAPFAGRVKEVLVKLGQQVAAGDPVLRVEPLTAGSPAQTLTAPVSGHVIRQEANPGRGFTPETSLIEIADDSELLAEGLFFQSPALRDLRLGSKARFLLDLFPGEAFEGTLQRLDTGHGAEDPSFHVFALLDNQDHRLRPNYRGRLVVELAEAQPVIAVPRRAILGSLGERFIFVENDGGQFERRDVVTGLTSGEWVEIIEGILPGERVVTTGNYQLQYITPEGTTAGSDAGHGHAH